MSRSFQKCIYDWYVCKGGDCLASKRFKYYSSWFEQHLESMCGIRRKLIEWCNLCANNIDPEKTLQTEWERRKLVLNFIIVRILFPMSMTFLVIGDFSSVAVSLRSFVHSFVHTSVEECMNRNACDDQRESE